MRRLRAHIISAKRSRPPGISPYRHLIDLRVRLAKELLLGRDQSIARIAREKGFASYGHFADHFRKLTGTTPSRYRIERQ